MDKSQYRGTGRRKTSVAQVRLLPGNGNITVNGRDLNDYFDYETLITVVKSPLELTDTMSNFDIVVKVIGGGDPRMKERKKYGLKKARRAPQFSKR